ncbi:hypothetical protein TGS27_0994 [Geobacillus stearothermophilus]|uniref:Uncharacterized protein n=1 Tax=Geobacillus stearothermophilus TaxID=1422 RepID=A0A150MFZ0_GEOSE|nr:hypothetical protein GS8_2619 [Geobacillus stearothermophilus]KYD23366.1 hypothetical protein B4109_2334 [Geobacillus stearothermophilus]OAO83777.1 hypothetical protein TGS27_0994 [Geobacillus stearothermophilus]
MKKFCSCKPFQQGVAVVFRSCSWYIKVVQERQMYEVGRVEFDTNEVK